MNLVKHSLFTFCVCLPFQAQARNVSVKKDDVSTWKTGDIIDGVCEIAMAKQDELEKKFHITCKDGTEITVESTNKDKGKK